MIDRQKKYYKFRISIIAYAVITFLLFHSCKKDEQREVENYYSAGVINSQVLSNTSTSAKIKLRFFIWDKSINNGLIPFDIKDRISGSEYNYSGVFDSLKRITTAFEGNYSAAVLISNGLDVDEGMEDYFEIAEPFARKFLHNSTPDNEVMLAKAGNKTKPVEIIGNGFSKDGSLFDQELATICKNGNYMANDSLSLLKAMDSVLNYMIERSEFTNRHLVLLISRRVNFYQDMNMTNLMNKALHNGINCHIIEICPYYYWKNNGIYDFLKKLNARSYGIYYTQPYNFYYQYEDGELPMDMLQVAGKLPDIFIGGTDCFEIQWSLTTPYSTFYSGKTFRWDFDVTLSTNFESDELNLPFFFYIN